MTHEASAPLGPESPSSGAQNLNVREGATPSPACPWQSIEPDVLRRRWQSAAGSRHDILPPFDVLSLDGPGGMGENVAILQADETGEPGISKAGKLFQAWLGREAAGLKVCDLPPDRARALRELYDNALREARPAQTVAYGIVDGFICLYDLVAVPLSCRPQQPPCMVYIQERERNFSLAEAIFEATTEGLAALVVIRDAAGAPSDFLIAALNNGAARLMHGTVEELRGRRLSEVLPACTLLPRILEAFNTKASCRFELTCCSCARAHACESRGEKHLSISLAATGDLVAMTLTDVSALKIQEKSFRLLFESNPVPMWLHCPKTLRFLAVNEAAIAHYGYSGEAFLAMSLLDLVPQDERDAIEAAIRGNPEAREGTGRLWRHVKADGRRIEVLASWREIVFGNEPAQLVAIMDVTEKREAEKRISHMACHDALTDLPNRVLFHERLNEALQRVRRSKDRLAVLCLDLDRFKNINDTLGHAAGDKLLMALAERLRACVRDGDTVARFGGDEFAILQTAVSAPRDASVFAERIISLMSEPYEIGGEQILSGVSIGIALAPVDGSTPEELLRNADLALYRSKQEGRRTFRFFAPDMDACARARHSLECDLRDALAAGEFELFYQPLVSLGTGAISGFEALLRWRSPGRGLVPPAEFIPVAEETGLIVPIGEWVLRQACAEAATWPDDLKVAVNLSPVQFKMGNLPQVVFGALVSAGLPASRLDLEITESILLEESKTNLATLRRLHTFGVGISMDDFGTGYSSLGYLRSFHFDKIKIDQSFIGGLSDNAECRAIVRTITKLASDLGIPTIAEGVETEAQRDLLRKEGCTEMQGYLFSKPVPASEIPGLLSTHHGARGPKTYLLSA
jgi:diguanylate cyclase (GGDEF)-like protein/PAS domain S-box-containing protein